MAITINGSGTITGVSAGGLPDGCVDNDTIATGVSATKLTGALPSLDGSSLTGLPADVVKLASVEATSSGGISIDGYFDDDVYRYYTIVGTRIYGGAVSLFAKVNINGTASSSSLYCYAGDGRYNSSSGAGGSTWQGWDVNYGFQVTKDSSTTANKTCSFSMDIYHPENNGEICNIDGSHCGNTNNANVFNISFSGYYRDSNVNITGITFWATSLMNGNFTLYGHKK